MRRTLLYSLFSILYSLILLTSCERRPLEEEFSVGGYADILLMTDWKLLEEEPTGLTAMFFPENEKESSIIVMSNNTVGNVVRLRRGKYKTLVFNQSMYEFGTMSFTGAESFETICATLTGLSNTLSQETVTDYNWVKKAFNNNEDSLAYVVRNPESFNADRFRYEVTEEMCQRQLEKEAQEAADEWGNVGGTYYIDTIYSTPPPVPPTMHITIHVKGIDNVYEVRAYLTNMAKSNYFGPHRNAKERATHVISGWKVNKSTEDKKVGTVDVAFRCFGAPSMQVTQTDFYQSWGGAVNAAPTRSIDYATAATRGITLDNGGNRLYVEFLLHDAMTTIQHSFDVPTNSITYTENQLSLDLDLTLDETLPDVPDYIGAGGAGFDADVEDWQEEEKDIIF